MTRDEALLKIKKCMALSKSAEPHEAAVALRQAQKLMEQFSVNEQDMSLLDVHEEARKAASAGLAQWEAYLARIIGEAFGCKHYMRREQKLTGRGEIRTTTQYIFVGIDASPALAAYAFDVLGRQCRRARLDHIKKQPRQCNAATKTARGDEFAIGWVIAAAEKVEKFAQPTRSAELLLEYMAQRHPDLQTVKARDTRKGKEVSGHRWAGYNEGQNAELNNGVAGRAPQQLIGG